MNNQNIPTGENAPLSEEALKKIRHAYHSLEAFQQTPAHVQAKAKLRDLLNRPREEKYKEE